ncbi:recombinase family protein, partial [Staphylococcus epidermidis]|uniref:recombinase family protein n=1 Tax=Staphylococcus epidermidis TaxID=1282 RepID=UPI0021B2C198
MQQLKTKPLGICVPLSTQIQTTQPYTIHPQINQIKQYSHFHHFDVKHIYPHPPISRKSMNRPHLQRMFKHPKEGN